MKSKIEMKRENKIKSTVNDLDNQGTCIQHGDLEANMRKEHGHKDRVNY